MDGKERVKVPLFPLYSHVRTLISIEDGISKKLVLGMWKQIESQTGTPQSPVDWKEPDEWIPERLRGDYQFLAQRIWVESGKSLNPRHVYGSYLYAQKYELVSVDSGGVYRLTERGKAFLREDNDTLRELDEQEGLAFILELLSQHGESKRTNLIPEWGDYLHEFSAFGTTSTISDTLWRRLVNLEDRGLVTRHGLFLWVLTDTGLNYHDSLPRTSSSPKSDVMKDIDQHNDARKNELRELLSTMPPYRFEQLIGQLLTAMGYEDVEVTSQSGDKGIDVVGTVQVGITEVKEVIQVKRVQSNITRPKIDQLRGALPYHSAIRGTFITLSDFSSGCTEAALFPGAAPITLINGEKLIELLVEHEIGIRKKPATLYEIDISAFDDLEEALADDGRDDDLHPSNVH
jgi:restriction system protein